MLFLIRFASLISARLNDPSNILPNPIDTYNHTRSLGATLIQTRASSPQARRPFSNDVRGHPVQPGAFHHRRLSYNPKALVAARTHKPLYVHEPLYVHKPVRVYGRDTGPKDAAMVKSVTENTHMNWYKFRSGYSTGIKPSEQAAIHEQRKIEISNYEQRQQMESLGRRDTLASRGESQGMRSANPEHLSNGRRRSATSKGVKFASSDTVSTENFHDAHREKIKTFENFHDEQHGGLSHSRGKKNNNGNKEGHWTYTFADGIVSEGEYKDGLKQGIWRETYPDGTVSIGARDGEKIGQWLEVQPNGTVKTGEWRVGKKTGLWERILGDGAVVERFYKDGLRHGHWKETNPNGIVSK